MKTSRTVIQQLVGKLFGRSTDGRSAPAAAFEREPPPKRLRFLSPEKLSCLEKKLGYDIRNPYYFEQALIHRSFLQVASDRDLISNERLEFLGDSILNMLIGEFLYHNYTDIQEGELTKLRSRLVNRKALTICARALELQDIILLNASAEQSLEQGNDSMLADAYEALVAAIYLDSDAQLDPVKTFLGRTLLTPEMFERILFSDENYKSLLLEYSQGKALGTPRYVVVKQEGPDHDRVFTVEVAVNDECLGQGCGRSKKEAEQQAAAAALEQLAGRL